MSQQRWRFLNGELVRIMSYHVQRRVTRDASLSLFWQSIKKRHTPLGHSRRIAKEKRTERTTRKLDIANVQPRSSFHIIDSTDWHSVIRLKVDANSSCLLSLGSRHRKLVTVRLYFSASTPSARIQIVHAFDPLHKVVLFAP